MLLAASAIQTPVLLQKSGVRGGLVVADSSTVSWKEGHGGREDARLGEQGRAGGGEAGLGTGPGSSVRSARLDNPEIFGPSGDTDTVRAAVQAYSGQVRTCYERALLQDGALSGRVALALSISGGKVTSAEMEDNDTGSAALASCIVGKARLWRFPADATMDLYLPFALSAE